MPNRVIREGFLDDEKINSLTEEEQMLFIRLTLVVDDFGCWCGRPEMIRSRCYPVTDKCLTAVRQSLDSLHRVGLIMIYEVAGKRYVHIPNFRQRLRKMVSKFPKPPEFSQYSPSCQTTVGQLPDSRQRIAAPNPESESESESRIQKDSLPSATPPADKGQGKDSPQKPKPPKKPNPWFDACRATFGYLEAQGGLTMKAAKALKPLCEEQGYGPEEIKRRWDILQADHPDWNGTTFQGLANHWPECKERKVGANGKQISELGKLNQQREQSRLAAQGAVASTSC